MTLSFILTSGSSGSCSLSVDQSVSGWAAVGNWDGDQSTSTSGLLLLAAGSRAGGRTSVVAWSCGGGRSSVVLLVAAEGSCASATESASGISGLIGSGSFICGGAIAIISRSSILGRGSSIIVVVIITSRGTISIVSGSTMGSRGGSIIVVVIITAGSSISILSASTVVISIIFVIICLISGRGTIRIICGGTIAFVSRGSIAGSSSVSDSSFTIVIFISCSSIIFIIGILFTTRGFVRIICRCTISISGCGGCSISVGGAGCGGCSISV